MTELVLFVLDGEVGKPAINLETSFHCQNEHGAYILTHLSLTGTDGCSTLDLISVSGNNRPHPHQVLIQTGNYYSSKHEDITFKQICIEFLWDRRQKLVLAVLISAQSYTSYRGGWEESSCQ